jgi:hypothetical protein
MTDADPVSWPQQCRVCGQLFNGRNEVIDHDHVRSWMDAAMMSTIQPAPEVSPDE